MLNVAVALLATLAALGGAGLLVSRTLPLRRAYFLAWSATLCALVITLGAMTFGYTAGFRPALLRTLELFGSLIAPLTLPLGVVELVARTVQARFAARLIAGSYVIVAAVVVLLDPIIGTFGRSLPKVSGHYSSLPSLVLNGAHIFAVVSLVSCVAVTALRSGDRDRQAPEAMLTIALVALAGVLVVATMRNLLPGPLAPLALGCAAALVWYGSSRLLPSRPGELEEPEYDDMSYHDRRPPYGPPPSEPPYNAPARNANAYNESRGGDNGRGHTGGHAYDGGGRAAPRPSFAPPAASPPGQYGRITIYTLLDGHAEAFDRLAAEVARAVRNAEPGTLVYTCHTVDNAPGQRIFYQLFRDAAAVEEHTRQPHVQRFAREARGHVGGTNVLELTVNAGNVAPGDGPGTGGRPAPAPAVRWPHG